MASWVVSSRQLSIITLSSQRLMIINQVLTTLKGQRNLSTWNGALSMRTCRYVYSACCDGYTCMSCFCLTLLGMSDERTGRSRTRQVMRVGLFVSEAVNQQNWEQVDEQSQRDRAAGWVSFRPEVEDWNWETIFCGHYRSIFNHCDVIGQQSYRIRWQHAT